MRLLLLLTCLMVSANAFSAETYNCNFGGSRFLLKMHDDSTITLENKFQKFPCEKEYTTFPGTEVEMINLVCAGKFKKTTYSMSYYDEETIILSPQVIFSKDVTCKKVH